MSVMTLAACASTSPPTPSTSDGSAPQPIALGVRLQTAVGDQTLSYFGNAALLFGEGYAVSLWLIQGRVDPYRSPLIMQATPLP